MREDFAVAHETQYGHRTSDPVEIVTIRVRGSGLVSRVKLGGEEYRYEHVHPGEHHDHIVCLHCGKVYEFESDEIEKLQDEICRRFGFHPRAHSHKIEGCCADCWAKPLGAKGTVGRASKREGR